MDDSDWTPEMRELRDAIDAMVRVLPELEKCNGPLMIAAYKAIEAYAPCLLANKLAGASFLRRVAVTGSLGLEDVERMLHIQSLYDGLTN